MNMILQAIFNHGHKQNLDTAIIIDGVHYTYRNLYDAVIERVQGIENDNCITSIINGKRHIIFIDTESVYEQLILWLAALYNGYIPIVSHPHMDSNYRSQLMSLLGSIEIPLEAQFGVLTSGTTGMPKPLWRTEKSWADYFDVQNDIFHINHTTRIFVHGSFSFTGNTNMILAVLWAGGQVVTSDKMQPKRWQSLIQYHRCTHIYMLPTKLRLLLRWNHSVSSCIRYIIAGSQVVDRELLHSLHMLYPSMEFILYYGASELNYITYCTGKEWLEREGTVGRPFPTIQIAEIDNVIYVTTKYHIEGIPNTYTVNDCGYIDSDGYLMFNGRAGDVINKGGYKISIPEMELYLQSLQGVSEVAIIDITDEIRGEDYVVYMVLDGEARLNEVIDFIHNKRPSVEWPKAIIEVPMLPLTECSKVDKRKLKEWYNKG